MLTNEEAVRTLRGLRENREAALGRIKRKTSWRPSEKAMAAALYEREIAAIDKACEALA